MNGTPANRTIEIVVSRTGEVRIQTRGFAGGSCREASRALEAALGARTSETLTPEFHARSTSGHTLRERS